MKFSAFYHLKNSKEVGEVILDSIDEWNPTNTIIEIANIIGEDPNNVYLDDYERVV